MSTGGAASAQTSGLFDTLSSGFTRPPPAATPFPSPLALGRPMTSITVTPRPRREHASTRAYCVRLCDGRHFPLPHLASSRPTPTELCRALCPTSPTRIYWGAQIDRSVAANGSRYLDLETALEYRRGLVDACTCNGRDVFGTAPVSIYADLTLRPGDVVVTENGLKAFAGSIDRKHRPADFTPVESSSKPSRGGPARPRPSAAGAMPDAAPKGMTFDARVVFEAAPHERRLMRPETFRPAR